MNKQPGSARLAGADAIATFQQPRVQKSFTAKETRYRAARAMGLCAASAIALVSGEIQAQESSSDLEVIIVTARKIQENVQTVPVSITAMTGAALQEQGVRTLVDVQSQVPNLILQTHPSEPQALAVTIRGQKQNDIVPTVDPSVGIYVDGYYLPRTVGLRGGLIDVDRVEVLRGPQGTLYGRNTTGGAISLYTKDPTNEFSGLVSGTVGNYDYKKVYGMVNAPLTQGIALRVVAEKTKHDGYGEDGLGRQLASEDGYYVRGKLRAEFGDRVTAVASVSHEDNDSGGGIWKISGVAGLGGAIPVGLREVAAELGVGQTSAGLQAARTALLRYTTGSIYHSDGTYPSYSQFKRTTEGLDVKIELSDKINFRSLTGYQDFRRYNQADYDGTPFSIIDASTLTTDHYFSQEFQLLGGSETFNWVVGAYVGDENAVETVTNYSVRLLNPAAPSINRADIHNGSQAAFAQANWEFAPKFRLTIGGRYSWDQRKATLNNATLAGCVIPAPGVPRTPPGASQCPRKFDSNFDDPSWLASVDYRFTDTSLTYAKIARGYRTGGINKLGSNTIETFGSFDPETVTEYEVGLKTELFAQRLRLNVAVFYDDYRDIQRSVTVPTISGTPAILVSNAAKGRIQGFEVESSLKIIEGVRFNASAGLTDAKYKEFIDLTGDRSKEKFPTPKWTASGSAHYEKQLSFGELNAELDYRWQSRVILEPTAVTLSTVTQDAYGLLNGRISLNLENSMIDIAVFGRNLTDKEYVTSGAAYETSLGLNRLVAGEPRTYGMELTKRF